MGARKPVQPRPPCTHEPKHCKGMCADCYQHDYRIKVRSRSVAYSKAWRAANPDKVKADRRKRYKDNPEEYRKIRNSSLKKNFGITLEEYERMNAGQGGLCAICRKKNTDGKNGQDISLCVDHNHDTGKVRALLCGKCNRAVGNIEDSPLIARALVAYLEKYEL